jgi:hypothetical protein
LSGLEQIPIEIRLLQCRKQLLGFSVGGKRLEYIVEVLDGCLLAVDSEHVQESLFNSKLVAQYGLELLTDGLGCAWVDCHDEPVCEVKKVDWSD